MVDIDLTGFSGMNNVTPVFASQRGTVSPRLVLNADADLSGKLTMRDGITAFLSLPGAHSLWACEFCMLCAAAGKLYRIDGGAAIEVTDIAGPVSERLSYCLCEGQVYISNAYWRGVFASSTNTVSDWGITLPPGPMLLSSTGNLPAGTFHVCFTNVVSGQLSGNGPITSIELEEEGGISILNRPAGALVWATDQNGYVFTLVGPVDKIVDIPTIEPLPNFMCGPPPNMDNLTYAFGRMWGTVGPVLYYSEPYQPAWFKMTSNRFQFDSDVTVIAKVATGLFVGMNEKTVFLAGTEPEQMQQSDAGAGSIKGTLAYCNNVPYLADIHGTPEKTFVDVPIWRTVDGVVAGNSLGRLFNLTKDKLRLGVPDEGASLFRHKDGVFQFLTSAQMGRDGSARSVFDQILREAVKNGRLTTTNKTGRHPESQARATEEVSIEVRRGGVIVPEGE